LAAPFKNVDGVKQVADMFTGHEGVRSEFMTTLSIMVVRLDILAFVTTPVDDSECFPLSSLIPSTIYHKAFGAPDQQLEAPKRNQ
jgi:hypothetical protein